jgi:HEAT repeat protein
MLRGLDDPPWGALSHAYGPADAIPEVIRAVASADEDEADAAVDELFGSVFHQGTVFSAAVAAVPFIAELALAPEVHHRSLLVYLLGAMADPAEAYGTEVGAVRAAVTAEVPRLLPLLADPDPGVRETAAYTLAQCPDMAGPTVAELRQRWAVEDVPLVRASLLGALGHLDPTGCAGLLSALGDPHPAVRAAAALAIASAGLPWPGHATAGVISAYGDLDPLRGWVWAESDSLDKLLERFDDIGDVPATVLGALVHAPSAQVRTEAAGAVSHLNRLRRSAPARLVPLLSPLLSDDDEMVRLAAAGAVRTAGSAGALVSEDLAALAAASPLRAESDRRDPAVEALRTLIQLGDPRWREPLLTAWRTGQAPYDAGELLSQAGVAFDPELLAAVRERLVRVAGDSMLAYNERVLLVWLLGSWGPAAAPAIPELLVALEHGWGTAPRALMAIGPAAAAALPALRAVASQGEVGAALAVWRLAGEPDPLLHAVGQAIDHDKFCASAIDQLLELGEHARPLLGSLRRFLTGQRASTFPARGGPDGGGAGGVAAHRRPGCRAADHPGGARRRRPARRHSRQAGRRARQPRAAAGANTARGAGRPLGAGGCRPCPVAARRQRRRAGRPVARGGGGRLGPQMGGGAGPIGRHASDPGRSPPARAGRAGRPHPHRWQRRRDRQRGRAAAGQTLRRHRATTGLTTGRRPGAQAGRPASRRS